MTNGTVYLVGAGPGDPDLITVRGLRLLQRADVVVHDRLVHARLLEAVRPGAERVYVGKAPGRHACRQEAIHRLLVDYARAGRTVVRLKGGDPFVFGRGGEEAWALRAAGVPFEVVPAVTSAIGAPAYAGIPVTHRGVAGTFAVVTGHGCGEGSAAPDWAALAKIDTVVILMGLRRLPEHAATLIAAGRGAATPAAVVASGTTNGQVVVAGTLGTIGALAAHLEPPATVVVGEVAAFAGALGWFRPAEAEPGAFPLAPATAAPSGPPPRFPGVLPLTHIHHYA